MNPFLGGIKQFFSSLGHAIFPEFAPGFRTRHLTEELLRCDDPLAAAEVAHLLQPLLRPSYIPGSDGETSLPSAEETSEVDSAIKTLLTQFANPANQRLRIAIIKALSGGVRPDVMVVMAEALLDPDPNLSAAAVDAYMDTITTSRRHGPFGKRCAQTIGHSILDALELRASSQPKAPEPADVSKSSARLRRWARSPAVAVLYACCNQGNHATPLAELIENPIYGHDDRYDAVKDMDVRAGEGFRNSEIQKALRSVVRSRGDSWELRVMADIALFRMSDGKQRHFSMGAWDKALGLAEM
ncbi:MAG: hypothetical protein K1X83_00110 [Oligoflexia bacterium]|nr:hypothetical protein [Oligoflexia bacterium]